MNLNLPFTFMFKILVYCELFKEIKSSSSCYPKPLQIAICVREIIICCVQIAYLFEKTNRDDD